MTEKLRWKQRFHNLTKGMEAFQRRIDEYRQDSDNEAFQMALVQGYEIIVELSWKVMKDYLQYEGYDILTGKQAIRQAYQSGLIHNGEIWLKALDNRNLTSHTYHEGVLETIVSFIDEEFFQVVRDFYLTMREKL